MRRQIIASLNGLIIFVHVIPVLLLLIHIVVVRSGQPISGLPDDGGFDMPERSDGTKVGHLRHAFNILEPELAQSVWSREGLKNPIRRTTTIPLNDLDVGNTGELQQKDANKPIKRIPRTAFSAASEYDTLNDDFLTEYDLLNLDFNLDDSQDGKKNDKEVEVPAKDFEWEEGDKRSGTELDNFPPKEWWDLEEPEGTSTTATTTTTTASTKRHALRGSKLFERESGRVRRTAKAETARQMHHGVAQWSGEEAIKRDEVKIWPKLVPILNRSDPRSNHLPVPTNSPPFSMTKLPATPSAGSKRISGGNDTLFTTQSKKGPPKKEQIFRDLPTGVEVVSSLVEKTVDNRKLNRNPSQGQKSTETPGKAITKGRIVQQPKKQNVPLLPHILDRDSPAEPSRRMPSLKDEKLGKSNSQSEQQKQQSARKKQEEIERSLDSLPTIIIGEHSDQPSLNDQSIPKGTPTKQHNSDQQKGQIEVTAADQSPQLPPGFLYLATVDKLPTNGRLLIGNRSYVIEQTLLQHHLFQQQQQQEQQRKVVANDGEFGAGGELSKSDEKPSTANGTATTNGHKEQQQNDRMIANENATVARGEGSRRFAPRKMAFSDGTTTQMLLRDQPTDQFDNSRHFQNGNKPNSGFSRKKDILARNLGLALSQIFGNFSIGHLPAIPDNKKMMDTENEQRQTLSTDSESESRAAQIVSEPHRLTRVFEKKRP